MKNLIYILGITLFLISCEDVIDVDTPNGTPKLVIDASFEYFLNEDPADAENSIRLTLSAPFFQEEVPPVSDAIVFVTNLTTNEIINFEESSEAGLFLPQPEDFLPNFESEYELTVIYEDETYKGKAQLIPTAAIDTIEQGDGDLFGDDETEIVLTFTDNAEQDNFYLFDFDFNLFIAGEDRFYQGETFKFSYFYEDMVAAQTITVKILGIDERYFNYSTILIDLSEQSGNPFQSPPVRIRGNIINTTNPDNYPLGYFNLSEADRMNFIIEEK